MGSIASRSPHANTPKARLLVDAAYRKADKKICRTARQSLVDVANRKMNAYGTSLNDQWKAGCMHGAIEPRQERIQ